MCLSDIKSLLTDFEAQLNDAEAEKSKQLSAMGGYLKIMNKLKTDGELQAASPSVPDQIETQPYTKIGKKGRKRSRRPK